METILVVDDEADVCELARDCLVAAGYRILEARDGEEALRVAEGHTEPIHLLLTDVIMPGLNGVELAGRLARHRPDTKVLYMSGFAVVGAQTEQLSGPGLQPGDPILPKPFSTEALTRKVREVLDRPAPSRSPFSRPRPRPEQWWP
jgi:two-component system, cell cycle sensor histidine kinase and response regulator CckA